MKTEKYYKIQYFSDVSISWVDRQISYPDIVAAKLSISPEQKSRIIEIDPIIRKRVVVSL